MIQYDTVISPCVSICRLDKDNVCMGCYRTVEEVREWYNLSNEEKQKILDAIEKRKPKKKWWENE